jgi:hypothetical protein
MSYPTNMPIAPSATVRHATAFRRCKPFDLSASVRVISTHNPWRPNSRAYNLFEQVLRVKTTTTIAGILEDAEAIGYYRADVMRHLRWLYTWGDFIENNGVRYFPKEPELDPVAPHERRKSKRS